MDSYILICPKCKGDNLTRKPCGENDYCYYCPDCDDLICHTAVINVGISTYLIKDKCLTLIRDKIKELKDFNGMPKDVISIRQAIIFDLKGLLTKMQEKEKKEPQTCEKCGCNFYSLTEDNLCITCIELCEHTKEPKSDCFCDSCIKEKS